MNLVKLDKVTQEIKRLVAAMNELHAAHQQEVKQATTSSHPWRTQLLASDTGNQPKHTGAVRRASMDLTRALADLRKPN